MDWKSGFRFPAGAEMFIFVTISSTWKNTSTQTPKNGFRKSEGKRPLERSRRTWKDDIKMGLK
jgi:hypothetical protein